MASCRQRLLVEVPSVERVSVKLFFATQTTPNPTIMSTTDHSFRPITQDPVPNPVEYEKSVYQNGLRYERPPFTFHSTEWEPQASQYLSANSKGYLVGNAGTGETARKNTDAFKKWSMVPRRLVETDQLPDLDTEIFGHKFQFPIAAAPVGVLRKLKTVSLSIGCRPQS